MGRKDGMRNDTVERQIVRAKFCSDGGLYSTKYSMVDHSLSSMHDPTTKPHPSIHPSTSEQFEFKPITSPYSYHTHNPETQSNTNHHHPARGIQSHDSFIHTSAQTTIHPDTTVYSQAPPLLSGSDTLGSLRVCHGARILPLLLRSFVRLLRLHGLSTVAP
ncbi:hypothetical protein L873DRAFT_559596 [Choiromyces venosus 120613-1]|uniref:Uncharacterized protein n=1 Tax=Choiromyces venosus 120613-1 TaxID=1336337 RepID=A0A3N4JU53_9PEZI|nr:hypothetical protein L873DRAFT_559596 [Choiromyces venosus 120613-1]